MALWDVFHSDRLELVRGLSAEEVGAGLGSGEIRDDDLVRPSGTNIAWVQIAEVPELLQPPPAEAEAVVDPLSFPVVPPETETPADLVWPEDDDFEDDDDDDDEDEDFEEADPATPISAPAPAPAPKQAEPVAVVPSWDLTDDDLDFDREAASKSSHVALPVFPSRDAVPTVEMDDEDEEPMISLTRSGPTTVEELDLAAMVDVAFQLVLFFLVTATTILYKTLEIPKPSAEAPPSAVAQGRSRSLDDLKEDYILVEIDAEGNMKLDREPVASDLNALAEQLRVSREKTGRKTMLLSADFATPHRRAVLAYDAANEIGLGIAIAKPTPPQGPAPSLKPAAAAPAAKPGPPN